MNIAGVILCGGRSTRMGTAKAELPFGNETLLERAARILASVTSPVIVVTAPDQVALKIPPQVRRAYDRRAGRGPLEGLLAGLSAVGDKPAAAFVTGCDTPLLTGTFVKRMADLLGAHDAAVPWIEGFYHPLAAVYRATIIPHIEGLLAADRLRPSYLFDQVSTRRVTADELRDVDPQLKGLRNLNTPADYLAALADSNLVAPAEILRGFKPSDER